MMFSTFVKARLRIESYFIVLKKKLYLLTLPQRLRGSKLYNRLSRSDVLSVYRSATNRFLRSSLEQMYAMSQFPKSIPWDRNVELANLICEHKYKVLGLERRFYGEKIRWRLDPITGNEILSSYCNLKPDYTKIGDIRYLDELNDHKHFYTLAKAYLQTRDRRYATEIVQQILDWIEENPPGKLMFWTSPLQVAIRAISWIWGLSLIHDSECLDMCSYIRILGYIYIKTLYIEKYLKNSGSANNHLIGEASAMAIVAIAYKEFRDASRWRQKALRILWEELYDQFFDDGVHKEQSVNYHLFVLDFYTHVILLCQRNGVRVDSEFLAKIEAMYDFVLYIIRPDGILPMVGDVGTLMSGLSSNENGRGTDARAKLSTGAILFNRGDMKKVAGGILEETLWLFGMEGSEEFQQIEERSPCNDSCAFENSGLYIMRTGWQQDDLYLFFDSGPMGLGEAGHGHADTLSFELYALGAPFIIDPGTYTYNGPFEWRSYFRGTSAHNTVVVDHQDQAAPLPDSDPFGWSQTPSSQTNHWVTLKHHDFVDGEHDGYTRLPEPITHRRRILFVKKGYWIVSDTLMGSGRHQYDFLLHFSPCEVSLDPYTKVAQTCSSDGQASLLVCPLNLGNLEAEVITGCCEPIQGWISYEYGAKQAAPVLQYTQVKGAPAFFDVVLYPYRIDPPQISVQLVSLRTSECQREISSQAARCVKIRIDNETSWYLYSNLQQKAAIVKQFDDFQSDGEIVYITKDSDGFRRIFIINGSFLAEGSEICFRSQKAVRHLGICYNEGRVMIEVSKAEDYMQVRAPNIQYLFVNGKEQRVVKKGGYIILRGCHSDN